VYIHETKKTFTDLLFEEFILFAGHTAVGLSRQSWRICMDDEKSTVNSATYAFVFVSALLMASPSREWNGPRPVSLPGRPLTTNNFSRRRWTGQPWRPLVAALSRIESDNSCRLLCDTLGTYSFQWLSRTGTNTPDTQQSRNHPSALWPRVIIMCLL